MTEHVFCCSSATPYKRIHTDHEEKFKNFLNYALSSSPLETPAAISPPTFKYAVQVVKQINFGALESKRYFALMSNDDAKDSGSGGSYREIFEKDIVDLNFTKVNAFKNFKCTTHDRFFELNLYQRDPKNKHHWRADVARPAGDIDL